MSYLTLPVDPNDAGGSLVRGGNKDGVTRDAVHVDAECVFNVIQMHIAILGDQEDHSVLLAHLMNREGQLESNGKQQNPMVK